MPSKQSPVRFAETTKNATIGKKRASAGRHAFWPIETMSPTPERVAKPDFEKDHHGLFARARTVQSQHNAHEISGDAVTAASWWLSDFVFAQEGYGD